MLCATHGSGASWLRAHGLPRAPGTWHKREVAIKAYQTACRRQPQISVAKRSVSNVHSAEREPPKCQRPRSGPAAAGLFLPEKESLGCQGTTPGAAVEVAEFPGTRPSWRPQLAAPESKEASFLVPEKPFSLETELPTYGQMGRWRRLVTETHH